MPGHIISYLFQTSREPQCSTMASSYIFPRNHCLSYFTISIQSTKSDSFHGFAFVYMDDERDARDAIRGLDRTEFGRKRRRLRVEWTKQESGIRRPGGGSGRSSVNMRPTKTLFVINFDPINTRTRDLERHFDSYGKILNIRIRRNFAFIQYEHQEDATKALDATNMSKMMDRVISVEYAIRDDDEDERRNGYSPDGRGRDRSPEKRNRDHRRSPNPYGRVVERGSPDYGRGPSPYDRHQRGSPDYGRERRDPRGSPDYGRERRDSRDRTEYGRGRREQHSSDFDKERHPQSQSPDYEKEGRERQRSQDYGRESREHHSPDYGRDRREQQNSPDYGEERHNQGHSPDYDREEDPDYDEKYRSRSRSRTPPRRENM